MLLAHEYILERVFFKHIGVSCSLLANSYAGYTALYITSVMF